MTENDLAGRRYAVTGGAGGIGRACAADLLGRGAEVLLVDIDATRLESAAAEMPGATIYQSALRSPDDAAAALDAARGPLDGLVHMAGLYVDDPLDPGDHGVWDRTIATNLTSGYDLATVWREHQRPYHPGSLVFCSSVSFRRGTAGRVAYSAAKGGVVGMVRALSREFGPTCRVNAVAPGLITTPMTEELVRRAGADVVAQTALRRLGSPADVAGVVTFLLSDAGAYVTGQTINVDGGLINS